MPEGTPNPRILLLGKDGNGKNGQVGWELQRALAPLGDVIAHHVTVVVQLAISPNSSPCGWYEKCDGSLFRRAQGCS